MKFNILIYQLFFEFFCLGNMLSKTSEDAAFSGEMIQIWHLKAVLGGTKVTIVCEHVPEGIRKENHNEGLGAKLENQPDHFIHWIFDNSSSSALRFGYMNLISSLNPFAA